MKKKFIDVLIIGAGPIGLACGIEAKKAELSYLIVDKGCLVNSIFHYPKSMVFFSTSDRLEIGDVPFISHGVKPTRTEALEYFRRVASSWKLNLKLYERIDGVGAVEGGYEIAGSSLVFYARKIIIASGFYDLPYLMNIEGEELPKVKHYYEEPHPYLGQEVLIIGAANSAVDVALDTYRAGARVTMAIREKKLKDSVKYWVKPDIENRIKEGSITAYFNTKVLKIKNKTVDLLTPGGKKTIKNDYVFAMTGYRPDFEFLTSMGIKIGRDKMKTPVYNKKTMETNQKGVYLAGVICGGLKTNKWFIENSRHHAEVIIKDIVRKIK